MKHFLLLFLFFIQTLTAVAQKNYPRIEIAGGYSPLIVDRARRNMAKGWNSSAAINLHRNLGIEANVSGHYGTFPLFRFGESYYLFQAGPRVAFRTHRLTPWAHALFGVSQARIQNVGSIKTSFAGSFGGGLDVNVHKRISLRVVQADYVRMPINDFSLAGTGFGLIVGPTPANNLALSFGVVLKLGGR